MDIFQIGFLGTKFAMMHNSCVVQRLVEHDLTIVFPHPDEIEGLHRVIIDELSNNIFTNESKQFYINVIQRLYDEQQVEGVVLGCTGKSIISILEFSFFFISVEIPLLVNQDDIPHIPLFDSTRLHVKTKKETIFSNI